MIQQHPAYHEGFYDAQFGEPIFDDCPSPEYRAGWTAFGNEIGKFNGTSTVTSAHCEGK
jgi:hypothetical protein